eukprot:5963091-Pyramimonas_sp.AAC.1
MAFPSAAVGPGQEVRKHCWLPSKQSAIWRHLAIESERVGGEQSLVHFHGVKWTAQGSTSGFDRRSVLPTRTYPKCSAFCLEDCSRSVFVKGTLSVGVGVPLQ